MATAESLGGWSAIQMAAAAPALEARYPPANTRKRVVYPHAFPLALVVVIDTEEEFDWNAEHSRLNTAVSALRKVENGQKVLDEYGIRPTYVVDYPVVRTTEGFQPLADVFHSGRCEIGAHLHTWVNPPFDEPLCSANTYACNLPVHLQRAKLEVLTDAVGQRLGRPPVIHKSGRYGIGPNTETILQELGYEVDCSLAPPFDFTADGGPDFSHSTAEPYWFGNGNRLLGLPTTGAFCGFLQWRAPQIYRAANTSVLRHLRAPGLLARSGAIDRLRLSPEDFTFEELCKLTRFLVHRGVRVLTLSFHSPSLEPGHTPYVKSQSDLTAFLDKMRRYFDFFMHEMKGIPMTPLDVKSRLESA